MVFPSVPAYLQLDPPNWNQPGHQQAIGVSSVGGGGGDPHHLFPPAAPRPEDSMAAAPGLARPASMADRARLAKVPQPEPGLKCPRCESTNTKFCYFNNYSLSQPRHFCKTCRRYWTRGGALRSVPVGGGCRRNKRSKSGGGGSKFSGSSASASSVTSAAASGGVSAMISSSIAPAQPQPPFMASLHNSMADYGAAPAACSIGLGFGGGSRHFDAAGSCFQVGGSSGGGMQEQWRLQQQVQQFPFFAGLEPPSAAPPSQLGLFPFNAQGVMDDDGGGRFAAQASVKNEGEPEGVHLPRQYLGIRNDHFWGGGGGGGGTGGSWTDISGAFNSASSCSNIL